MQLPIKLKMLSSRFWAGWFLLLAFALDAALCGDQLVVEQRKSCAPGCTDRGNCNAETGLCECPWGYSGPACEVDKMAACRQTPDDPGSCGTLWPKHCDCYKACRQLYCPPPSSLIPGYLECPHELGQEMPVARCWRHKDPGAAPSSLRPEGEAGSAEDGGVLWYKHYAEDGKPYDKSLELPAPQWRISQASGNHVTYPLSDCPGRCNNGRGVCFKWGHEQQPRCLCRKGYNGTSCSERDLDDSCFFSTDCSGRGVCLSGMCHCQKGYFGVGCHRSTAFQPGPGVKPGDVPDLRHPSKLKIYLYELPWEVAFPYEYNDGHFGRDPMYLAYEYFMRYFLQDKTIRTENPYEANLFYIPMLLYFYIGNVRDPVPQAARTLEYVQTNWPFYNRSGGRDHFFWLTGDRGSCPLPRWLQDTGIKVLHFGLQRKDTPWQGVANKEYGCVKIKRDLMVPPMNMFIDVLPVHTEKYYQWLVSNKGYDGNRTLLFFFAGGVGEGTEYSGGVRQTIKRMLDSLKPKPEDVEFLQGRTTDYSKLLRSSKFCIAPYGYGWGLRLVQAVEFGCIPLIIQDHVYQAFEDFMPYEEFSVRLPLSAVGNMVELLRSYTDEQLAALRLGMARYYRAFIWNREFGGQAYEWTLVGLQRRLTHLQAEYYDRRRRRREE